MYPICPPNFALPLFVIFLGITAIPREIENNAYAFFFFLGGGGAQIGCIMGDVQEAYCFSFAFAADNCGSIVADSCGFLLPHPPIPQGWPVHVGIESDKSFPLDQVPV